MYLIGHLLFNQMRSIFGKSKKSSINHESQQMETKDLSIKLIFIDIDGVFNNANSSIEELYCVEPFLLQILKKIIDETGAELVLSSTWRYTEKTRKLVREAFETEGIKLCMSNTPNLKINRTDEILVWMKDNTTYFDETGTIIDELKCLSVNDSIHKDEFPIDQILLNEKIKVSNFIVIDDMDLMQEGNNTSHIKNNFIHINKKVGITDKNGKRAIALLNQ